MARSIRIAELELRLRELREALLPVKFSDTGTYPDRVFVRTRGYVLLAHAELEACLEDLVVDAAARAHSRWTTTRRATPAAISLLAFSETRPLPIPLKSGSGADLDARLRSARDRFCGYAKDRNHGLRERNILRLLLPIGFGESDIDSSWISTTDSFCRRRGDAAHQSGVAVRPDPRSELSTVRTILKGVRDIDGRLQKLA